MEEEEERRMEGKWVGRNGGDCVAGQVEGKNGGKMAAKGDKWVVDSNGQQTEGEERVAADVKDRWKGWKGRWWRGSEEMVVNVRSGRERGGGCGRKVKREKRMTTTYFTCTRDII